MGKRQNVILIVDDTPENLRVLGELLEADGHEVRVATNGTSGLEIASASGVDLILLDIMMPGMDGYEVCKRLKREKPTKDIPVIFLTALDSPDDEAKGLKLGAVDYITKPFKLELVRSRVANQLALHNARLELRRHNDELEVLVAERSQELAEAHQRLLTLDSAKYDFLQMIYQKLWAPDRGIIDLSRAAFAELERAGSDRQQLRQRYEESQAELFDTINNALLMAGTHSGDEPARSSPVRLEVVLSDAMGKWAAEAQSKGVKFAGDVGRPPLASGDLDLVFQIVATAVHTAVLIASQGSSVVLSSSSSKDDVVLELAVDSSEAEDLSTLFDTATRFHPSLVGKTLGLAIPLASKVVRALGGSISLTRTSGWTIRITLPPYVKKSGVKITL